MGGYLFSLPPVTKAIVAFPQDTVERCARKQFKKDREYIWYFFLVVIFTCLKTAGGYNLKGQS